MADAYDVLLSDMRVGLALGPVLLREGDYFGNTVNLAYGIVDVGNPGTALISDEFRDALLYRVPDGYTTKSLRPRILKDFGPVQVWWLGRMGEWLHSPIRLSGSVGPQAGGGDPESP
jgi:class 3 adenylate cyclase